MTTVGVTPKTRVSVATRIGKIIGSVIGTATNIATGYVWASHGFWWGAAIWFGTLLVALAAYGALKFPWRGKP